MRTRTRRTRTHGEPPEWPTTPVDARVDVDTPSDAPLDDALRALARLLARQAARETLVARFDASESIDVAPDTPVDTASSRSHLTLSGTYPIGIESSGRTVLLYLATVTVPWTEDFRRFLQGHAALLRLAPTWTLRLVFPRPVDHAYEAYQTVIREELETPLHPATIREVKLYFEHRPAPRTDVPARSLRGFSIRARRHLRGPGSGCCTAAG